MPDFKSPLKRFGFKRSNATGDPATNTTINNGISDSDSGDAPVVDRLAPEFAGDVKHDHSEDIFDISEVEANRRLSMFNKEHFYDPNMPDTAFEAVDEATQAHDQKGEKLLVGELIDDSPYPEVSDRQFQPSAFSTDHWR